MLAPPLTILSVCDWAILSRIPLMDSSLANRLSALLSTLLRPLKHLSACRTDSQYHHWNQCSHILVCNVLLVPVFSSLPAAASSLPLCICTSITHSSFSNNHKVRLSEPFQSTLNIRSVAVISIVDINDCFLTC